MKPRIIAFRGGWVCYGNEFVPLRRGFTPHTIKVLCSQSPEEPYFTVVGLKGRTPYEALCRWKKAIEK